MIDAIEQDAMYHMANLIRAHEAGDRVAVERHKRHCKAAAEMLSEEISAQCGREIQVEFFSL